MYAKVKGYLSFHKEGIEVLKLIHKVDTSAVPVAILKALVQALYPYINLFLSAYIIDGLMGGMYREAMIYVGIMIVGQLIIGSIQDVLVTILDYKSKKVFRLINMEVRRKALEIDYETLEDAKTLENINSAVDTMGFRGGFGKLLTNYCQMLAGMIAIVTSVVLVIHLCFQAPSESMGVFSALASVPVSLSIVVLFLVVTVGCNFGFAKHINDRNVAFFKKQVRVERFIRYYVIQVMMAYEKGKAVRLYNMNDMINKRLGEAQDYAAREYRSYFQVSYLEHVGDSVTSSVLLIFSYSFVVLKVVVGAITVGGLMKYVGAITQLNSAMIQLVKGSDEIRLQCETLKYFTDFMKLENKRETGTIPVEKRTDHEYEIEFHNVTFAYPGSDTPTLKNVSCKINMKHKMAIVGRNGAGKTTFIKLITRLYDPTEGMITLNGIDIKKYDYKEYLKLFSVVFQDFSLFAFPIEQNVATSLEQDPERVWEMLGKAGMEERVRQMPNGIKTPLYKYDEGGVECSGGELQKIAIARALYKDAPVVILDEPTAALDPISEYEIYSRFDKLVEDKTSIYISHRMSSCRFCDDIIVFDDGHIVQRGSHGVLMREMESLYADMWEAQASYYVS